MPKIKLTDRTIAALPIPEKGRADYWDAAHPNFGLRISQGGTKTFVVLIDGNRKALGSYPLLGLSEARDRARKALYEAKYEPAPAKRISPTYSEAVERFLRNREPELRRRTYQEYQHYLETVFAFSSTVEDLTTSEIADALDDIDGQSYRAHAYTALKVFLNWCMQRDYLDQNPMAKLKKPKLPSAKERVLSDDELKTIWHALHTWPDPRYALIVRLLMVTGQRANQIASLQEPWIDYANKIIRFPRDIMKNGEPHDLPFGTLTEFLLRQAQPVNGWYFSPPGDTGRPFTAWSKQKAALDKVLKLDPWTLHQFRHTWSSNAPRLNIDPHITERILAHKAPMGKVAAIYDRFKYEDHKRQAMKRMESHITDLVSP